MRMTDKRATALTVAAVALLLGGFVVHVIGYYFLCDDAYISFRYVRNWLAGDGLVFNPGERVEGYTNFLWVVELAAIWKLLGVGPELSSIVLSGLYTAGTIAVLAGFALSSRVSESRRVVLVLALLFWVTNRSAAVWTTGGLETRQFTFFVLLGAYAFRCYPKGPRWLLIGSTALALAEYTRPEALMLWGMCAGWYGLDALFRRRWRWSHVACAVAPFALLVAAHFGFRYLYYGELLPNTYYAKQVGPWPELGLSYLSVAALEYGSYVVFPLALVGTIWRLWRCRDATHLLMWMLIIPHLAYLAYLGGDLFEFRPMDYYWPILYVATAEGIWALAAWLHGALAARDRGVAAASARWGVCAVLAALVVVYGASIGWAHHAFHERRGGSLTWDLMGRGRGTLNADTVPWLFAIPGMSTVVPTFDELLRDCLESMSGQRHQEHRLFWKRGLDWWQPYERFAGTGFLPPDAVMKGVAMGVMPYHLPDLRFIDVVGLTDKVVARNPDLRTPRRIAHSRQPPPGYLAARGVNIELGRATTSLTAALGVAPYAVALGEGMWMPFRSARPNWVGEAFAGAGLVRRPPWPSGDAEGAIAYVGGRFIRGLRWLGRFDGDDLDGWQAHGADAARLSLREVRPGQAKVRGRRGAGMLNTFAPDTGDAAQVRYVSPPFRAQAGEVLAFWIGGGGGDGVGVELHGPDGLIRSWRGKNRDTLAPVLYPLDGHAGPGLWIEVVDRAEGSWGHILADQFLLARALSETEAVAALVDE